MIGFQTLSEIQLATLVQLYGPNALNQRDILNDFYSTIILRRHDSISVASALVESLLRFGMNHLTVEYYFAILTLAHTFNLNRQEIQDAV